MHASIASVPWYNTVFRLLLTLKPKGRADHRGFDLAVEEAPARRGDACAPSLAVVGPSRARRALLLPPRRRSVGVRPLHVRASSAYAAARKPPLRQSDAHVARERQRQRPRIIGIDSLWREAGSRARSDQPVRMGRVMAAQGRVVGRCRAQRRRRSDKFLDVVAGDVRCQRGRRWRRRRRHPGRRVRSGIGRGRARTWNGAGMIRIVERRRSRERAKECRARLRVCASHVRRSVQPLSKQVGRSVHAL